jgi:polyhydroxyalkanoate synthase
LSEFSPTAFSAASVSVMQPMLESIGALMKTTIQSMDFYRLNALQAEYMQEAAQMFAGAMQRMSGQPPGDDAARPTVLLDEAIKADRRFAAAAWHDKGVFEYNAALYALNSRYTQRLLDSLEGDEKSTAKLRYVVQQWIDAMSPANFLATNPEAQQAMLASGGESLGSAIGNLLGDLHKGRISQTDESAFEVGCNVAVSPGDVIFQNDVFQLIQYQPTTAQVASVPLLMVPPFINKFYILDLQPSNSYVGYAVAQGHTVFMVSWRNPTEVNCALSWDDYVEHGVLKAIEVVQAVSKQQRINALGFCVGGTLLCTALAYLAAQGQKPVQSLTLLTTLLDFADAGTLGVFIDEAQVRLREQTIGKKGLLPGKDLASAFSSLRPNDLIWNYVVRHYLKGEKPTAFDLLYWNADSTNLPGPLFCWYLRQTYLENKLCQAGKVRVCGEPVDLSRIDVPVYVMAAREDHIVPWAGAYRSAQLLSGPVEFVLGASGHIAGVVNPAARNKRSFWTGPAFAGEPEPWLTAATEHSGSWWGHWADWLGKHSGKKRKAPAVSGSSTFEPLEPAPGAYVKTRAS